MNASDVARALDARYKIDSTDRQQAEQWICIEEARSGPGTQGNAGQCDYLAINSWRSRREVVGHEIKVSKSDWKTELNKPEKSEMFSRYCHRWWVVMPWALAQEIQHEVPDQWGLLGVQKGNRCRELVAAPRQKPEPLPTEWLIGWLTQIDRQYKRKAGRDLSELVSAEVENQRPGWEYTLRHGMEYELEKLRGRDETLKSLEALVTTDGRPVRMDDWRVRTLARVWPLIVQGPAQGFGARLESLAHDLGPIVEAIRIAEEEQASEQGA